MLVERDTHASLVLQIGFVSDEKHGEFVSILDPEDLLLKFADFGEARVIGQRERQQEALSGPHVLLAHRAELLLAGRVQNCEAIEAINGSKGALNASTCGR